MKQTPIIWLGNICPTKKRDNPNQGRVYSTNGCAPTLSSMSGGNRQPMVCDKVKNENDSSYRIRKPTPKECWRLMGFKDKYF